MIALAVIAFTLTFAWGYENHRSRSAALAREAATAGELAHNQTELQDTTFVLDSVRAGLKSETAAHARATVCIDVIMEQIAELQEGVRYVLSEKSFPPVVRQRVLRQCQRDLSSDQVLRLLDIDYGVRELVNDTAKSRIGSSVGKPPPTAIAQCNDGTLSYHQRVRGACSWHDGVAIWFNPSHD